MADRTLSLEATPVQKGWYLHNTQCLDPFNIYPLKFHLMKSSSEVEGKTQSWFQGLFEFTERERVVRTESFICIPSKARLVHLHWPGFFWLYFLVVDSVFVAIFFGGWFSPRNSWSALHSSDKFEKIVFSLTSDWSKMGTGSLGNLSKLQICEVC